MVKRLLCILFLGFGVVAYAGGSQGGDLFDEEFGSNELWAELSTQYNPDLGVLRARAL